MQQINESVEFYRDGDNGFVFSFSSESCDCVLVPETPTNQISFKKDKVG